MRVSRSIGLLSYRGSSAYNATQQENDNLYKIAGFRATTYQQYQGDKLCRRFDAYSYYRLTQAFDSHNVGRYRGGIESALGSVASPTMVVGISSDMIFPVSEQVFLYRHIPQCQLRLIDSAVRPRRVPGRIRQAERAAQTVHRYADGPVTSRYFHRECCFSAFFFRYCRNPDQIGIPKIFNQTDMKLSTFCRIPARRIAKTGICTLSVLLGNGPFVSAQTVTERFAPLPRRRHR